MLAAVPALGAASWAELLAIPTNPAIAAVADVHDGFPAQDPVRVREVVAVSHGNLDRVRELVEPSPALAKASWD